MNNLYMKMSEEGLFSDDFAYTRDANSIIPDSDNQLGSPRKTAFWKLVDTVIEFTYEKIFKTLDYFGYVERYFVSVSSWFWAFTEMKYCRMAPSWLWCLFYLYVIIIPHVVSVMLVYRMMYDHFILEPKREEEMK